MHVIISYQILRPSKVLIHLKGSHLLYWKVLYMICQTSPDSLLNCQPRAPRQKPSSLCKAVQNFKIMNTQWYLVENQKLINMINCHFMHTCLPVNSEQSTCISDFTCHLIYMFCSLLGIKYLYFFGIVSKVSFDTQLSSCLRCSLMIYLFTV